MGMVGRMKHAALAITLVVAAGACGREDHGGADAGPAVAPATLRETGLYADWATGAIAADVMAFVPQYPLWTDGATKRRWLRLPAGATIDASRADAWQLPVGTQVWKEFSFGRRVETRYMARTADGWIYATYVWSADGGEARLAPARGVTSDVEVAPGVRHRIPGEGDCLACHDSAPSPVLGFTALQLSPDRDPHAPHAEALPPGAVDLATLARDGRLRGLDPALLATPPRIDARSPVERAALGYLHGNCGGCHHADGPLASLGMLLREPDAALATLLDQPSRYDAPGVRVAPGDPDASVLLARVGSRHPAVQMPPIGTQLVDEEAVRLLATWIDHLD